MTITQKPINLYTSAEIAALSPQQKLEASRTLLATGYAVAEVERLFGASDVTSPKGLATAEKAALMRDKGFVQKFLDGDTESRRKMAALDLIISA